MATTIAILIKRYGETDEQAQDAKRNAGRR